MRWSELSQSVAVKRMIAAVVSLIQFTLVAPGFAQDSLRLNLGDVDLDPTWIYDDWEAAQAVARRTGQPIFVVFR